MSDDELHFAYEDHGPNCLIGSHGIFFARVQQTPKHNAAEYARLFCRAPRLERSHASLLAACKAVELNLAQGALVESDLELLRAAIAQATELEAKGTAT